MKYASVHSFALIMAVSLGCSHLTAQSENASSQPVPQAAQTPVASTPSSSASQTSAESVPEPHEEIAPATSKDRLFFGMPNFLTLENGAQVPPLTAAQKFKVTARGAFDPFEYFWYGMQAGINQAHNSEPGYGQGASGYAKRYAASFADGTIENFMVSAVVPSILHQDPRYFQMGKGGFWHRAGYAMSRIWVTRGDNGHSQFNFSEVGGAAGAAWMSTYLYHPVGDRTTGNTISVWGTMLGYDTLTLVVKEFWPDIRKKLHHSAASAEATSSH